VSLLRQVYNQYVSSDRAFAKSLKQLLGFMPGQLHFYRVAFQHKSLATHVTENNERLEFLGDSILNAVVAEILYRKYPSRNEGFLTNLRSKIISRDSLNTVGIEMNLAQYIKSLHSLRNFNHNSILGNCLEALVGAVYMDQGFARTHAFIKKRILSIHLDIDGLEHVETNYKSKLLEWSQRNGVPVVFKLLKEQTLRQNQKQFTIGVLVKDELYGTGSGKNKKHAAQRAAEMAYNKVNGK
jgi:ribonuclease-3